MNTYYGIKVVFSFIVSYINILLGWEEEVEEEDPGTRLR